MARKAIRDLSAEYLPLRTHEITLETYHDGNPALMVRDLNGNPQMRASVNLDVAPRAGCIFVKDWSENEGILEALIGAGILEEPIGERRSGHVVAWECPVNFAAFSGEEG